MSCCDLVFIVLEPHSFLRQTDYLDSCLCSMQTASICRIFDLVFAQQRVALLGKYSCSPLAAKSSFRSNLEKAEGAIHYTLVVYIPLDGA